MAAWILLGGQYRAGSPSGGLDLLFGSWVRCSMPNAWAPVPCLAVRDGCSVLDMAVWCPVLGHLGYCGLEQELPDLFGKGKFCSSSMCGVRKLPLGTFERLAAETYSAVDWLTSRTCGARAIAVLPYMVMMGLRTYEAKNILYNIYVVHLEKAANESSRAEYYVAQALFINF
ncbi:hypothetical protein Taro_034058 [Colocasia esculenta]|uniref:Uncharacterized protein n=1 Tax=Colocasia esculenta TaxID=4460 RepID=A0A843W1T4_COLES|nr:hypothetical protein [Colocasia esculenta]